MRQHHVAGERMFVDYAGATIPVIENGTVRQAELFVAALGASNYTFAEATWTQTLPDWIGSHGRALAWFGGVPAQIVSDNLKSGVTKACFYEPAINRTYADMATHYDTAVVPARPYKPRDKAKVEVAVQVAQRWIVARLRRRRFFSLSELNAAIRELVLALNDRVTRHLGTSRRQLFEDLERPALAAARGAVRLRAMAGAHRRARLPCRDRPASLLGPHRLLRQKVWARATEKTVEVFHDGQRVAAHLRSPPDRRHTTLRDHMPSSHRRYADWTPEKIRRVAAEIGPGTEALIAAILSERSHPEQGFRSCLGILRLARTHAPERLEAACQRALEIGARSYTSVNSILKTRLDRRRPDPAADGPTISHPNIRGAGYFH